MIDAERSAMGFGLLSTDGTHNFGATMSKYITRQEVAVIAELSVDTVRRNEKKFGLSECKQVVNARLIRYRRTCAISALVSRGIISV